jgi:peptidoglycan/LPS O-acetylase OafA/YrhL
MSPISPNPSAPAGRLSYRPEIDGLRAVAVGSVFIFHLEPQWLPGGFVGVDIFFVLSGYLITRIICHELKANSFSLAAFYQRRIARIAPALSVVCAMVLVAGAFLYSEVELATVGASVAATASSILNLKLIFQENYFKLSPDTLPLLHCWSLSLEEQFYLCYPLFVWLVYRAYPSALVPVIATMSVLSFIACVIVTAFRPNVAFYLTLTRAWELGCGGLIALCASSICRGRFSSGHAMIWIGASMLAAAVAWTPGGLSFPGYWALLPVAGVSLILACEEPRAVDARRCAVIRCLAAAPAAQIGKISYSLYLWHWPVFSFIDYRLCLESFPIRTCWKVLLTAAFAWASYALVEKPLRSRAAGRSVRLWAYSGFVISVVLLVAIGVAVRQHYNPSATLPKLRLEAMKRDHARGPELMLLGDSTACMFASTLRDLCRSRNEKLIVTAVPGENPLPATPVGGGELWRLTETIIKRNRPTRVVLSARWTTVLATPEDGEALRSLVSEILLHSDRLIILAQPPILPVEATRDAMRNGSRPPFREHTADAARRREANDVLRRLASQHVRIVDLDRYFMDDAGALRLWDGKGNFLFIDRIHVSSAGAKLVAPELLAAIENAP